MVDLLVILSKTLDKGVEAMKTQAPTSAEEWNAITCIGEASRLLISAAAWLERIA